MAKKNILSTNWCYLNIFFNCKTITSLFHIIVKLCAESRVLICFYLSNQVFRFYSLIFEICERLKISQIIKFHKKSTSVIKLKYMAFNQRLYIFALFFNSDPVHHDDVIKQLRCNYEHNNVFILKSLLISDIRVPINLIRNIEIASILKKK